MAELRYKVRGNSPQGKARVYFCCHPDDFADCFEEISEQLLALQDCAVWYRSDFSHFDEDLAQDLAQMQLFVIPVTAKFLTTENDALRREFDIAVRQRIPVLPLMQEPGLEQLFNETCGELQSLSPHTADATAIRYEEKLKKYLESVLIGDELAEQIRAAFDAYIFLSYRKKDRRYAQELMKLIHKNEFCRDIAIWYDEFLTPGENFNDSIRAALRKSDLFVLTVTPNLVNEPNYVEATEYPMALEEQKPVFPVELVPTDKQALLRRFAGLAAPTSARNEKQFSRALGETVRSIALQETAHAPEHNFFIGLAYLGGVDVEVDRERAVSLITEAAEGGLAEAMKKLAAMYRSGDGIAPDCVKAVTWAMKYFAHCRETLGDAHPDTMTAAAELAQAFGAAGNYREQLRYSDYAYNFRERVLGREHPDTLTALSDYAVALARCGHREEALIYSEKAYSRCVAAFGEEALITVQALSNLGFALSKWQRHLRRAYECRRAVYEQRKKLLGETHPETVTALFNLAMPFADCGMEAERTEMLEQVYAMRKAQLGEAHPATVDTLFAIADCRFKQGQYLAGIECNAKVCKLRRKILSVHHAETKKAQENLELMYRFVEQRSNDTALYEAIYAIKCDLDGETDLTAIELLKFLADRYGMQGDEAKKAEYLEKHEKLWAAVMKRLHRWKRQQKRKAMWEKLFSAVRRKDGADK